MCAEGFDNRVLTQNHIGVGPVNMDCDLMVYLSFVGRERPLENEIDLIIKNRMGLVAWCDDYLRSIRKDGLICREDVRLLEIPVQQTDSIVIDYRDSMWLSTEG